MVEGEDLHVTEEARELAVADRHAPAGPAALAPGRSSSPTRSPSACCRRACAASYGFAWDPVRAVAVRGGAEYAKRFVVPFLPERLRVVRSARRAA